MRSRKHAIGFGLLFAVAATVPAYAQPAAGPGQPYPAACNAVAASESDRAHTLYQAGKAYYDDGVYDSAITQFREAYKKDCTKHDLLIIISRAYELNTNRAEAIRALETYLERVPSSPDAQQHRNRIENLKKQLAAQPPVTAAPTTTTAPPVTTEIREHTAPPWIVVALGGAAVLTGVVLLVARPDVPANCNPDAGTCSKGVRELKLDQEQAETSVGLQRAGVVTLIIGAGLIGGGLLWHFLEPTGPVEKPSARPRVTPLVAPGFAGLSLGGRF